MNIFLPFDVTEEINKCESKSAQRAGDDYDNFHKHKRWTRIKAGATTLALLGMLFLSCLLEKETESWFVVIICILLSIVFAVYLIYMDHSLIYPPKMSAIDKEYYERYTRDDFIKMMKYEYCEPWESSYLNFLHLFQNNCVSEFKAYINEDETYSLEYTYVVKRTEPFEADEIKSAYFSDSFQTIYVLDKTDIYLDLMKHTLYIPYMYKDKYAKISFDLSTLKNE